MLITWRTSKPFQRKVRFNVSANTYALMLPMCWYAYTVGPHEYIPTFGGFLGWKADTRRVRVLNSRSGDLGTTYDGSDRRPTRPRHCLPRYQQAAMRTRIGNLDRPRPIRRSGAESSDPEGA